ncbi:MAG: head-tail connector protein [Albidovulum sp.]
MTVALVTLARVKQALRVGVLDEDGSPQADDDDAILEAYIDAASEAVVNYLGGRADVVIPGLADSPPTNEGCPKVVEQSVCLLVGYWYREPDGDAEQVFDRGYLPKPVTALLYPLRDPALA